MTGQPTAATARTTFLTQTIADAGGPVVGDCWRTAVGCLLGLADPLLVPHFVDEDQARGDESSTRWWTETVAFAAGHLPEGQALFLRQPVFPVYADPSSGWPHVIASGPSPRGDWLHAVIVDAVTGDLVWDPHPSRAGLAGPPVDVAAIGAVVQEEVPRG